MTIKLKIAKTFWENYPLSSGNVPCDFNKKVGTELKDI